MQKKKKRIKGKSWERIKDSTQWKRERKREMCSRSSGSRHSMYTTFCLTLSLPPLPNVHIHTEPHTHTQPHTHTHNRTQSFYSVEWAGSLLSVLREVHLKGTRPFSKATGNTHIYWESLLDWWGDGGVTRVFSRNRLTCKCLLTLFSLNSLIPQVTKTLWFL